MNAIESRKGAVLGAEVVNLVFGIWVALSPFALGFGHNTLHTLNNIVVGIILILIALGSEFVAENCRSLVVPLAIWLFVSPFVLGVSTRAFLANNVIMAFMVITAGAITDALVQPGNPDLLEQTNVRNTGRAS
ncbi:MAG TPA: SPW repeat protein [Verrucomicrobiae bacterium]|nr:SPW repeat protein [Verrucomicrobiae bacterium]